MGLYTDIRVYRGAVEYLIDDMAELLVTDHDGLGLPSLDRLTFRGARQHGETDAGFLLNPRVIKLGVATISNTYALMYARRAKLLRAFMPSDSPGILQFTLPGDIKRQIYFHAVDNLSFPSSKATGSWQKDVLSLYCPDPAFFDPVEAQTVWLVTGSADLVYPITYPIQYISSAINEGKVVQTLGTWFTYPDIILTGPMQNPVIENVSTGEKLALTHNMVGGEVVTYDLRPGYKTVTSSIDGNIIGSVSEDSDIGTFHLGVDPDVPNGDNTITLTAGGMSAGVSQMQMKWHHRFIGL